MNDSGSVAFQPTWAAPLPTLFGNPRADSLVFMVLLPFFVICIIVGAVLTEASQRFKECMEGCVDEDCTEPCGQGDTCTYECRCGTTANTDCKDPPAYVTNWDMHYAGVTIVVFGCVSFCCIMVFTFAKIAEQHRAGQQVTRQSVQPNIHAAAGAELHGVGRLQFSPNQQAGYAVVPGTLAVPATTHGYQMTAVSTYPQPSTQSYAPVPSADAYSSGTSLHFTNQLAGAPANQ
eukprot:gene27445-33149_t